MAAKAKKATGAARKGELRATDVAGVYHSEYAGSPLLTFTSEPDERWPFSFGAGKAAKLLQAMATGGICDVLNLLLDLAGDKLDKKYADAIRGDINDLTW